jgi:hypothetical protein
MCLYACLSSMQCACAISSYVASPAVIMFPRYIINVTIYGKKSFNNKINFIFSTTYF